jgi:hypothetical protein
LFPISFWHILDKLESSLEEVGCVGRTLASIIIILLYDGHVVHMVKSPYDLHNELKFMKDFHSSICMTINTNKEKVMIIKSRKMTYVNFVYDNKILEEVTSYKYPGINLHLSLTRTIGLQNDKWRV